MTLLFLTVPFAGALVAVAYAPPAHFEVAGQTVSVKPVLGQDTSRLIDGALVRREHAHVDAIGKDIGVDVDADWNRLIPSDERTRQYLVALWEDPTPQIGRIEAAARRYLVVWSNVGFVAGAAVVGGIGLFPTASRDAATEFTGGSTGGHVDTKPDPGVITHPARFAILTLRPDRGEVRYSVVTVAPDATVTVTPEISLDVPFRDFTSTGRTAVAADDR